MYLDMYPHGFICCAVAIWLSAWIITRMSRCTSVSNSKVGCETYKLKNIKIVNNKYMRLIKWIAVQVKKLNKQKNEQFMLNPHVNINEKCKAKCKQKKGKWKNTNMHYICPIRESNCKKCIKHNINAKDHSFFCQCSVQEVRVEGGIEMGITHIPHYPLYSPQSLPKPCVPAHDSDIQQESHPVETWAHTSATIAANSYSRKGYK